MSLGDLDWEPSFPFRSPLRLCVKSLILLGEKYSQSHAGKRTLPSGQKCAFSLRVDLGMEKKPRACALAFKSKLVIVGGGRGKENC